MSQMDYGSFTAQWWQSSWPGVNKQNFKPLATRVAHESVDASVSLSWSISKKKRAFCLGWRQHTQIKTQTCAHRHAWANWSAIQYWAVTRHPALYKILVIWSYNKQMDTHKGYCKDFHLIVKKKRGNPYPIHSNHFLFVLHVIRSHLADMVYECTTLPQHGRLP